MCRKIGHEIFLKIVTFFSVHTYVNDSVKLIIEYLDWPRNRSARKHMVTFPLLCLAFLSVHLSIKTVMKGLIFNCFYRREV